MKELETEKHRSPAEIKCADSYQKGLRDSIHKCVMMRDFLLGAFIAETGALPSECCIVEERVGNKHIVRIVKSSV